MIFTKLVLSIGILSRCASAAASNDLENALGLINQARQQQGLQPLAWSPDLAAWARLWADEMASGSTGFRHASGPFRSNQGENLFEQQLTSCNNSNYTYMVDAVEDWLGEAVLYDGQPILTGQEEWLHWSQCVWSGTTMIGCATAYSTTQACKVFDVCRYYPEGNIIGQRPF